MKDFPLAAFRLQCAAYQREREKSYAERREWKENYGKRIRLNKFGVLFVEGERVMASPHFDLWDKTMPPIEEDVPTATEINFRHTSLSTKPVRFSKSGVPLVKEKE